MYIYNLKLNKISLSKKTSDHNILAYLPELIKKYKISVP